MRRATIGPLIFSVQPRNFYPRSPCGERRSGRPETRQRDAISIHALLAESDVVGALELANAMLFLSTLSLRRATRESRQQPAGEKISIHALLAESDRQSQRETNRKDDFYPRSPCGERQAKAFKISPLRNFYPRSPCGERQQTAYFFCAGGKISIHALLAESDVKFAPLPLTYRHFYPRSPCGERLCRWTSSKTSRQIFLSTLSLRRATLL